MDTVGWEAVGAVLYSILEKSLTPYRKILACLAILLLLCLTTGLTLGFLKLMSFGDSFAIAGFAMASTSILLTLLSLHSYLGMETVDQGTPLSKDDTLEVEPSIH